MRNPARLTVALTAAAVVSLIAAGGRAEQAGMSGEQIETLTAALVYLIRAMERGGPWVMGLAVLGIGANIAWLIYWLPRIVKPLASAIAMIRRGTSEREQELEGEVASLREEVKRLSHQVEEQATVLRTLVPYIDTGKLDPAVLAKLFGGEVASPIPAGAAA